MDVLQNQERTRSGSIPTLAEQEDVRLVQASQQGDQAAFALLVQRHQGRVFNLVLHLLHDYDDANDVTQEAFLAAWRGLPAFRNEARFSTWLYRIAYNGSMHQLEQRKREQARHSAAQAQQFLEEAGSEKQAEEALERDDRMAMLREQMDRLPTQYRVVLILRYLHGKTYEEMARILTLPIGTIKTHLFRAGNVLKTRMLARQEEDA